MKPINPISVHLNGIITTSDLRREIPKESPIPNRVVAGGLIKRKPIDRTARIVTAPANWMCKPLFSNAKCEIVSNQSEILRKELARSNQSITKLARQVKKQRDLIVALVFANRQIMIYAESVNKETSNLRKELHKKELLINVL